MVMSYAEARELVRREAAAQWRNPGVFCLDDRTIVENDEMWVFKVGAFEYLVRGDRMFAVEGGVPVVYKRDGRLRWLASSVVGMDRTLQPRENPEPTLVT